MPKPPTDRSAQKLSELARHVVIPKGIVTTAWPRVEAQCAEMGVRFPGWQKGIGQASLGKRRDGKYAATVGGVVLSIPRQVGKTFLVGMIIIALCVLHPGFTALWTAHRTRTATKTFQSLQAMVKRKKIWPHIEAVRTANGEQEIRFRNGSVIMFGAREQGFGRGFEEVDAEVFDEAQILSEKALEDMIPAANQSRQEAGALLFFMGTPPRPSDPGEEFSNRRQKALSGKSSDMVYVEFSADENADCDDREQWMKANPSFPVMTPLESMLRMRENLTDDMSFKREAMGIWDPLGGDQVIDADTWARAADASSMAIDRLALAVDVSPDRRFAAVAIAGLRDDGRWHIELDEHRKGVDWVEPWLRARCERNAVRAVIIDELSPAASLIDGLKQAKITVTVTRARDMAAACGTLFDSVSVPEPTVVHTDQPQVNGALVVARKRPILDGGWGWNRKTSDSDITPLVACTLALWGAQNSTVKKPMRRARPGGRVGVVL